MNAPAIIPNGNIEAYRASTDAASVCKEIVVATATTIQGRKYVNVEGWQAIAIAHGCAAGARDVERVEGGVRAIGEIRRMSDGAVISVAEGFVGEDEETWYGGPNKYGKVLPKRADYAIRAMAQTRAISRACRSAFAHVVVMMNAGLATTPAEEVPPEGFNDNPHPRQSRPDGDDGMKQARRPDLAPTPISDAQMAELMTMIEHGQVSAREVCELAKIKAIKELPATRFDGCVRWINEENGKRKNAAPAANAGEFDALNGDDVPY